GPSRPGQRHSQVEFENVRLGNLCAARLQLKHLVGSIAEQISIREKQQRGATDLRIALWVVQKLLGRPPRNIGAPEPEVETSARELSLLTVLRPEDDLPGLLHELLGARDLGQRVLPSIAPLQ